MVTGQGSIGVSADNSAVSLQVLDGGALAGALELASQTDANAGKNLVSVLGFAKQAEASVLDFAKQAEAGSRKAMDSALMFAQQAEANARKDFSSVLGFAQQTDANNRESLGGLTNFASGILTRTMDSLNKSSAMIQSSASENNRIVAQAYDLAKGQGNDARILSYGALAVIGLVAVKTLGK